MIFCVVVATVVRPVKPESKKLVESIESNPVLKGIGILAALILLIWGAATWIDSRARNAVLNNEKFLTTVA